MDENMQAAREMPKYRCHKEVWALKIRKIEDHPFGRMGPVDGAMLMTFEDSGYAPLTVTKDWVEKHDAREGGYYVVYKGGYVSFSPADAFEDGYTKI